MQELQNAAGEVENCEPASIRDVSWRDLLEQYHALLSAQTQELSELKNRLEHQQKYKQEQKKSLSIL